MNKYLLVCRNRKCALQNFENSTYCIDVENLTASKCVCISNEMLLACIFVLFARVKDGSCMVALYKMVMSDRGIRLIHKPRVNEPK